MRNPKLFSMLIMLISGSLSTLILKSLSMIKTNNSEFTHPYFLTSLMFIGESFCLLLYKYNHPRSLLNYSYSIPAFFDLCASTLMLIALILSSVSVYQMMRGLIIIIVGLYSSLFLKEKIFPHQFLGMALCFVGLFIVGLSSLLTSSTSAKNPGLGIFLMVLSQFFAGGIYVSEQYLMKKQKTDPLQVVGTEGSIGFFYYLFLLPVLNLIPCESKDYCNFGYIENSVQALSDIFHNFWLGMAVLQVMICVTLFNISGVHVTKHAGAVARSTIDTSRTLIIWCLGILLGWENFSFLQLGGFGLVVLGTLTYNEILIFQAFGVARSVDERKFYLESREVELIDYEKEVIS
jgi:drug/metabolite transporter (DMT)-like permease